MGFLPTSKSTKITDDPKNLILYSSPKSGKTSNLAQLPHCLLVDMEDGAKYYEAFVAKASSVKDLYNIAKALKEEEHNFKFVALDTVTALEDIACELACKRYKETPMGKNFEGSGGDILKLAQGAGYLYLRQAMQEIIGWFEKTGLNIILVGHVKDKMISENNGDLTQRAIDLSGKISNILAAKSDAIGFLTRSTEENKVYLNFGTSESVISSARPEHLNGKTILLSEKDENGNLKTYWENVYPSLKNE